MGLEIANRIELTRVHGKFEADAYFPELEESNWDLKNEQYHEIDDQHKYAFTYLTYERK